MAARVLALESGLNRDPSASYLLNDLHYQRNQFQPGVITLGLTGLILHLYSIVWTNALLFLERGW